MYRNVKVAICSSHPFTGFDDESMDSINHHMREAKYFVQLTVGVTGTGDAQVVHYVGLSNDATPTILHTLKNPGGWHPEWGNVLGQQALPSGVKLTNVCCSGNADGSLDVFAICTTSETASSNWCKVYRTKRDISGWTPWTEMPRIPTAIGYSAVAFR